MRPGRPWAYLAGLSELGADEAPEQHDAQEGDQDAAREDLAGL